MPGPNLDNIIRSKRRTLGLEITQEAKLIIRAPHKMPDRLIEKLVLKKQAWIEKKQREIAGRSAKSTPKEFTEGEQFLYLGAAYPLTLLDSGQISFAFNLGFQLSKRYLFCAKQTFLNWYKKEALMKINESLEKHSLLSGIRYNGFKITGAKKRWGSCTPKNNLNFSWRLIMAPPDVIDYVVTHELAHIEQRNHSKLFWRRVSEIFPEFKRSRTWLKANGHKLNI